jgi:hypothetical protein
MHLAITICLPRASSASLLFWTRKCEKSWVTCHF